MRHVPVPEQGRWLGQVVRGYLASHAVPTNSRKITSFKYHVTWHWRRALSRRSQKGRVTWARIGRIAARWLPPAQDQPSLAATPLPRQTPEVGAECVSSARSDLSGGRRVKPASLVRCQLLGWQRCQPGGKESGEPHASLWPTSPSGRYGPAFPRSAIQVERYPGTRHSADPAYKVARCGALPCSPGAMAAR